MASKASAADAAADELRAFGMQYPGAHRKSPWPGHDDLAVKDKTFAYLNAKGEPFKISCKLPENSEVALMLPFCEPTPYGLGKSGWVTAMPPEGKTIPVEMFKEWIDESYRAQAPKALLKQLEGGPAPAAKMSAAKKPAAKKPAAKKPAAKKPAAKKPAARKPAAKKPAAKKLAVKKPAAKKPAAKKPTAKKKAAAKK